MRFATVAFAQSDLTIWYVAIVLPILILATIVTIWGNQITGKAGEHWASEELRKLPQSEYRLLNDLVLKDSTGLHQIDHVVVSIYGIFSIETKNYKGQIYGSESSAKWTQNIYGHKYSFMNPIYQNYAHVKALNALLQSHGYENIPVFSIVTFPGDAVLKIKTTKSQVVKWGAVTKTVKKLSVQSVLSREDMDKILGLEYGADDYVTKPFGMMELVSRIKAVLRRTQKDTQDPQDVIVLGDIEMNTKKHEVIADGEVVTLTLKEYELLKRLMKNPNIVMTRDCLLEDIWGYDFDGETRTVDVHVRTLRQKLGKSGEKIETVRGVGYRMSE